MRTDFLLIRHGEIASTGTHIVGWTPGLHLTERGLEQARSVAARLGSVSLTAIFSSPIDRTRETAEPLAQACGLPVKVLEELGEMRFGDWTGKSYLELKEQTDWRLYNRARGITPTAGGELASSVQARMMATLLRIRQEVGEGTVAVFSHGDPIRLVLAYCLGMPIDFLTRIEIDPGSVSLLSWEDERVRVLRMNDNGESLEKLLPVR